MKTALLAIALACSGIASAGNAPDAPALTMTEQGIGPITAGTPFDADVIRKLLPSLEVKRDVSSTEGEELPVLLVSDKRGLLLTIHPDEGNRIFSVALENDRVANALAIGPVRPINTFSRAELASVIQGWRNTLALRFASHRTPGAFIICSEVSGTARMVSCRRPRCFAPGRSQASYGSRRHTSHDLSLDRGRISMHRPALTSGSTRHANRTRRRIPSDA